MAEVLVLVDRSTHAATVISAARGLARLLELPVRCLHVRPPGAAYALGDGDVPTTVVTGDPVTEILRAVADPGVTLAVLGIRDAADDDRVAGHVAFEVIRQVGTPVLVVPPGAAVAPHGGPHALLPLDGEDRTTAGLSMIVGALRTAGVDLHAMHVIAPDQTPRFWDQPGHAAQSFGAAFAGRASPDPDIPLAVRTGMPAHRVLSAADDAKDDMILLCWSPTQDPESAAVVSAIIRDATAPVLLVTAPRPG